MNQQGNIPTKKCSFVYLLQLISLFIIYALTACSPPPHETPRFYTYKVITTLPHDENAFTQGFLMSDGFFYESTGRYGASSLRRVDPESGEIIKFHELENKYFGEGLTVVGNKIIQLTWREHIGFVYDRETFSLLETFRYETDGWGLTYDGKRLIMSDGTATLYFLDPETFETVGQIEVSDEGGRVTRLNELEWIKGHIYANVWGEEYIVLIDPVKGRVVSQIDLTGLRTGPVEVLNGIAYDARNDRIFVTGKLWPQVFEIELIPIENS